MSAGISLHTFANICMPTCYQLLSSYHDIIRLSQIKSVKMRKHPPGPSTEDARGWEPASPRARAAEDGHAAAHDGCTHDGRTHGSHDGRQGDANGTQRRGICSGFPWNLGCDGPLFGGDVRVMFHICGAFGGPAVKRLRHLFGDTFLARATDPWRVLAHSASVGQSAFGQQHLGLESTRTGRC